MVEVKSRSKIRKRAGAEKSRARLISALLD